MNDQKFSEAVGRQYHGGLTMLRNAINNCPDDLWNDRSQNEAPFWQHVMHTLFFTRLYCCDSFPSEQSLATASDFMSLVHGTPLKDWSEAEQQRLRDSMGPLTEHGSTYPRIPSKAEMLEYLDKTDAMVASSLKQVAARGLDERGPIPWIPESRADLLLYNMRHVQHHVGRLHSMLGRKGIKAKWVGGF